MVRNKEKRNKRKQNHNSLLGEDEAPCGHETVAVVQAFMSSMDPSVKGSTKVSAPMYIETQWEGGTSVMNETWMGL